ncbi:MAG: MBL fold metallo-hydrolase [Spirochaetota bacterium]|nr:MBL fold metallo-hydrolase [Spirochaetota bacterium]
MKHMKSPHPVNLGITTCYMLNARDGYLLIDTGYEKDYPKFRRVLAKLGIGVGEIRWLLLTHHHDDHAGFAARLVEETGCRLIVHTDAVEPLARGESLETMEPLNGCIRAIFGLFSIFHGGFRYPPLPVAAVDGGRIIVEADREIPDETGIGGRIITTPGHCGDSISVILDGGEAFVGDAAMNFLNFCRIRYRPIYVEDRQAVFRSWEKILDHGARMIYPAHGRPFPAEELVRSLKKFIRD